MSGSNQLNHSGIYGDLKVPSQSNVPGGRAASISWVDDEGSFWIFGGIGYNNGYTKLTKFDLIYTYSWLVSTFE
jgi:hypothetical protein